MPLPLRLRIVIPSIHRRLTAGIVRDLLLTSDYKVGRYKITNPSPLPYILLKKMEINLVVKNYRCFTDEKPLRLHFGKGFTAFVGVNNAGKSSILKMFHELRSIFHSLSSMQTEFFSVASGNSRSFENPPSVFEIEEMFTNLNERDISLEVRFSYEASESSNSVPEPNRAVIQLSRTNRSWSTQFYKDEAQIVTGPSLSVKDSRLVDSIGGPKVDFARLMDGFNLLSRAMYVGPFRHISAFKSGDTTYSSTTFATGDNYFDLKIGQDFLQLWSSAQTGKRIESEAISGLVRTLEGIFGFARLTISSDSRNLHINVDGKSFKLSELGSGLAQFILVLGNAVLRKPSYILVDEPELHLHPVLQRAFLNTLGLYATEGLLFTTHSYGLARANSDVVFTVTKDKIGGSEIRHLSAHTNLSEFLGELNFAGYQELGFDKLLLVEGPTDGHTIQQLLRKLKIDHRVLTMHLGGSSSINANVGQQLEELKRITPKIAAVIDSERTEKGTVLPADRAAFQECCNKANIPCLVLERRSMDNYLTDVAIKKVKGEKYRALGPYEKLNQSPLPWSKEENWKIASTMQIADFNNTDLGKFLSSL